MTAVISNIAKGKEASLAALPAANDALIWVLLKDTGIEAASVLQDYDTLAALLAGASDEITSTGYSRQAATGVSITKSNTTDDVLIDANDPSWTFTASVQNVGGIVLCYDDDTTGGTDTNLVPIFADVFSSPYTPSAGAAFSYQVATGGFVRVA